MNKFGLSGLLGGCFALLLLSGCGGQNTTGPGAMAENAVNDAMNSTGQMNPAHQQLTVEQAVANRVAGVNEVRHASVLVANRTAYVAVQMQPGVNTDMAKKTKAHIIRIVKENHPEITNVLVTANADAYQQFQTYANELNQGKPVTGIWNRFSSMVQRIWPNAS
jgi:spore cortex protein